MQGFGTPHYRTPAEFGVTELVRAGQTSLAVILLAARFGVPVCPHAGGVGLCEYVQHLSLFDYVCLSADLTNRVIEYVDHLHEHFVNPVVLQAGCYMPQREPGYSAELHAESLADHSFPGGRVWRD